MRERVTLRVSVQFKIKKIVDKNPSLTVFLTKKSHKPYKLGLARFLLILRMHVTPFYFLVVEQIFRIFDIGTICFDVQNPNASCSASVIFVLV